MEGFLFYMSASEENIFCNVDESACLGSVVNNESMVIVYKGKERLSFLLFCKDGPLGYAFEFHRIHLDILMIDDIH